ncbi:glycosyltransferase family 4 protein [Salinimonas marina]|uniref:Glycosyltransferase family 4 protein n=1 Tax=Salinimonas marina TaxID=2785918 RepID=A0A7S9HCI2_9ALTE|nr:glycosyltransferase family 4 protein [Salinimonas marina]QPG05134.1 glycosyltransferase family 4 protein [Salinimonas marina]
MVILLCDLPEPLHGMSSINQKVQARFCEKFSNFRCINTSPSLFSRFYGSKFWAILKAFRFIISFLQLLYYTISSLEQSKVCYRSLNGGIGQLYDILFMFFLRAFRFKVYLHHHSFAYLNRESNIFRLVLKVAGEDVIHVVLGDEMKSKIVDMYGVDSENFIVVSNLAFFDKLELSCSAKKIGPIRFGHLANLCLEKGVDVVVNHVKRLRELGYEVELYLAGGFVDEVTKKATLDSISLIDWISYEGAIYGEDKISFFEKIDVFYFPSNYKNEAEPLVLYEAAREGCLLIGTPKGVMQSVIKRFSGYVVNYGCFDEFLITYRDFYSSYEKNQWPARIKSRFAIEKLAADHAFQILIESIEMSNAKAR